ncbi:hypothetical protein Tco_0580235 [Tanacetum coccineum]
MWGRVGESIRPHHTASTQEQTVRPPEGGSSSAAAPEVSAPTEVGPENVVSEDAYLDLTEPDEVADKLISRPMLSFTVPVREWSRVLPAAATVIPPGENGYVGMFLDGTLPTTRCWMTVFPAARWLTALPPGFFSTLRSMEYEQLYTEFNVGGQRPICLESASVRSRAEHELELKEKLKGKYDARGRLLEEKDLEILRLKSLLAEEAEKAERAETAEVVRLRDQVSALTGEVSALKSTIAQKDTDISLLDSRATYLKSALDDSKAACAEAGSLITSLTSERDRLTSEVSTLHTAFQDFKEKAEAQQEEQAQVLYNRVAELEAHVMDHGIQLAMLKCLKSPEYQGILGHALGRAVDFGMQEGLEAGYEHGVAGTQLFAVEAYNPEAARTSYFDAVRALEDVDFPLVNLLKSKKDAGMDEVLDCFILDGPLADLPEAAHLQPCLEQLSVPIHHSDDKAIVGETSLSFALLNVHSRAEGDEEACWQCSQLMMEIVSNPLSSQTWVGETSTSAAPLSSEELCMRRIRTRL